MKMIKCLSRSEELVMKVIWDSKEDIKQMDLISQMNTQYEKEFKRTTVCTFLERMEKKGYVKSYKIGRCAYVHAIVRKDEYVRELIKSLCELWFDGNMSNLAAAVEEGMRPWLSQD